MRAAANGLSLPKPDENDPGLGQTICSRTDLECIQSGVFAPWRVLIPETKLTMTPTQRATKSWAPEARAKQGAPSNRRNHRGTTSRDGLPVKDVLQRMIGGMTPNFALRQDLLQEALIHLWRMKTRRPGQTRSWYVQSCKFHLTHYLASGCSVDSIKRGGSRSRLAEDFEQLEGSFDSVQSGDSVMSQVIVWDLISVLSPHLCPCGRAVLDGLADGLGAREIGRRLKMSHTMVRKYRAKIASLLVGLERLSLPRNQLRLAPRTRNGNQANGVESAGRAGRASAVKRAIVLIQPNHINGTARSCVIPAGALEPRKCDGLLKLPEKPDPIAISGLRLASRATKAAAPAPTTPQRSTLPAARPDSARPARAHRRGL